MRTTHLGFAVLMLFAAGCATTGGRGTYGDAERVRAETLFQTLTTSFEAGQFDAAALAGQELINSYPAFARMDEALYTAAKVADARGKPEDAAALYTTLASTYPTSPLRDEALVAAAADFERLGDPVREAENLLEFLRTPAGAPEREAATRRLRELTDERLSTADLEALSRRFPDTPLARGTTLKQARAAYARADYDRCYELLDVYFESLPRGETDEDAQRLMELAAERRQAPTVAPATRVNPDRVGLLIPQTGSLALYGRLFEQGARRAVEEHNADHARRISLVVADTRGGAVEAVLGARKLIVEEGAVAVVGEVFTLPAIASSIESNAWRTPIVSPVVASDDLVEIGPWVFQTRVPATVEATAVAEAAVGKIGLERVAVLAPSRGDRRAVADFFASEVRRLGRSVVATEYFDEGVTDFKAQLERIRDAAPDALYAVGSVEELLQILPAARFFDLQVQLLGSSAWSSEKLMRLAREELEGAVFPAESHYGFATVDRAALEKALATGGAVEASPISLAGYFGTRVVLEAIRDGASSREDIRRYLEVHLRGDAETRMARAASVPLVRVRAGKLEPFAR